MRIPDGVGDEGNLNNFDTLEPAKKNKDRVSNDNNTNIIDAIVGEIGTNLKKGVPIATVDSSEFPHVENDSAEAVEKMKSNLKKRFKDLDKSTIQNLAERIDKAAKQSLIETKNTSSTRWGSSSKSDLENHNFQILHTEKGNTYAVFDKVVGKGGYKSVKYGIDINTGEAVAIGFTDIMTTKKKGRTPGTKADLVEQIKTRKMGKDEADLIKELHGEGSPKNGLIECREISELETGMQVVVTDFCARGELEDNYKTLDLKEKYKVAEDVADGLELMHEKNVINHDLKGANVLLKENGDAKIIDLNCSKKKNDKKPELRPGTPTEWSPECFEGETMGTEQSDIFSYGLILYDLFLEEVALKHPNWVIKIQEMIENQQKKGEMALDNPFKNENIEKMGFPFFDKDIDAIPDYVQNFMQKESIESLMKDRPKLENLVKLVIKHRESTKESGELVDLILENGDSIESINDIMNLLQTQEKSLRGLICRCCRHNPEDRPSSMSDVKRELAEYKDGYMKTANEKNDEYKSNVLRRNKLKAETDHLWEEVRNIEEEQNTLGDNAETEEEIKIANKKYDELEDKLNDIYPQLIEANEATKSVWGVSRNLVDPYADYNADHLE